MPSNTYTNPGNSSWTAPFATRKVIARVVGGGGSGYRDCDGDDEGGVLLSPVICSFFPVPSYVAHAMTSDSSAGIFKYKTKTFCLRLLIIKIFWELNLNQDFFLNFQLIMLD